MKLGAVFPTTVIGTDVGAIKAFGQGIEELGFNHLIAYDHVLGAPHAGRRRPLSGPYDEHDEFHEVFVLFGFLAAVTSQLELTVGVLVAPQRQTALVAKQAAELQLLSEGRLRLGMGTGWNWVEFESLGADFDSRGAVLDRQTGLLRRLWSDPLLDYTDEFHRIDRAGLAPLPEHPIPLWFGGYALPALRRSATTGDGHLFGHLRPEIIDGAKRLQTMVVDAGRDPATFGLEAITDFAVPADEWIDRARRWSDSGGTHLSIRTMPTAAAADSGCRSVDDHLAAMGSWIAAIEAAALHTPTDR
jgi:probable F420-dependent oxidoreductase